VYSRVERLGATNGMVGYAWNALHEAFCGEQADHLLLVTYETLTSQPREAIAAVHDFIGNRCSCMTSITLSSTPPSSIAGWVRPVFTPLADGSRGKSAAASCRRRLFVNTKATCSGGRPAGTRTGSRWYRLDAGLPGDWGCGHRSGSLASPHDFGLGGPPNRLTDDPPSSRVGLVWLSVWIDDWIGLSHLGSAGK
jgi:hypothetical protein